MTLHANPMVLAPRQDLVRVLVVRLATLRFVPPPVEPHRGVVEQLREPLLVRGVLGLVPVAVEHVDVAAEQEVVRSLFDGDLHTRHGTAGGIQDANFRVHLAVFLDGCLGIGHDFPFTLFRGLGQFLPVNQGGVCRSGRRADRETSEIKTAVW